MKGSTPATSTVLDDAKPLVRGPDGARPAVRVTQIRHTSRLTDEQTALLDLGRAAHAAGLEHRPAFNQRRPPGRRVCRAEIAVVVAALGPAAAALTRGRLATTWQTLFDHAETLTQIDHTALAAAAAALIAVVLSLTRLEGLLAELAELRRTVPRATVPARRWVDRPDGSQRPPPPRQLVASLTAAPLAPPRVG